MDHTLEKDAAISTTASSKIVVVDKEATTLLGDATKAPGRSGFPFRHTSLVRCSTLASSGTAFGEKVAKWWKTTYLGKQISHYKNTLDRKVAYVWEFKCFLPYVWPSSEPRLYLNIVGVGICLLGTRILNVLIPMQLGAVIDSLAQPDSPFPFSSIVLYISYRWLANTGLASLKGYLWGDVDKWSSHAISTAAYNRVMGLSSDYHDTKSSGRLYTTLGSGDSIIRVLKLYLIDLAPHTVDATVAFGYLSHKFGIRMAAIVAATTIMFFSASVYQISKKDEDDRRYIERSKQKSEQLYDSMGCWSTVCYFNRLKYEQDRYSQLMKTYLDSLYDRRIHYYVTDAVKDLALDIGRAGACLLVTFQIRNGHFGVGDMSALLAYWVELTNSINGLTNLQYGLQSELTNAEGLLKLFKTLPSVRDGDSAFVAGYGQLQFKDVSFSYDNTRPVLKNINFTIKPGQKVALVGPSGSGKSTILKLIFRSHDPTAGSLNIDGQDLKNVTMESFREHIGIVPQNATMFNKTIMENVRYSKLTATDDEVMDACKAAAIHDQVSSFKDGYQSVVGEHGVKLSGGQLQRLAIARAILKDPKILLLDEPTSSVDTETERQIQSGLKSLTAGRTTIAVAHRLSTIADADYIIVVEKGTIAEEGSFRNLLQAKGRFYTMWSDQAAAPTGTITFDESG